MPIPADLRNPSQVPYCPAADGMPQRGRPASGSTDGNLTYAAGTIDMSLFIDIHMDILAFSAPQDPAGWVSSIEPDAGDHDWTLINNTTDITNHSSWPPEYVSPDFGTFRDDGLLDMTSSCPTSEYLPDGYDPLSGSSTSASADLARPIISHHSTGSWSLEPQSASRAESASLQFPAFPDPASVGFLPTAGDRPHSPSGRLPRAVTPALPSSGSSNAVPTPTTGSSPALSTGAPRPDTELNGSRAAWDAGDLSSRLTAQKGPCSKEWTVPKKTRRRAPSSKSSGKREREVEVDEEITASRPRKRGKFKTEHDRAMTALTRKNRGCIRCRMLRDKCEPDPQDPQGVCIRCMRLQLANKPVMCKLPCLRWIITDSSLYREQDRPYQMFSRRWQSMDLVDMDTWASPQTRTISVSQIFLEAPYEVEVREFVPVEGDMLEEMWTSGDAVVKRHAIPRYAICDIKRTATVLEAFIDKSIGVYINGAIFNLDTLLWSTYIFAFGHIEKAKTQKEKDLLRNVFRLWVGCLKTSHPEHICGDDRLGAERVDDPGSVFHGAVPMPVIMIAQMECIMYTRVLRPMTRAVLRALNELVQENRPANWLTVYLAMFILFHCCSVVTRRDWEFARQCSLRDEFANPESIKKHQCGMQVMLAHFHYLNKGVMPFSLTLDSKGLEQLSKVAELDADEVSFISKTANLVQDPTRRAEMSAVLKANNFRHDLYWVSQLYEQDWKPGSTA
ncbi:hypothetical protein RB597_006057 [Gaeumannomyces tritici]